MIQKVQGAVTLVHRRTRVPALWRAIEIEKKHHGEMGCELSSSH